MIAFALLFAMTLVVFAIIEAVTGRPDAQGTPRLRIHDNETGETHDETGAEYTERAIVSGVAFFGPLIAFLGIAAAISFYVMQLDAGA